MAVVAKLRIVSGAAARCAWCLRVMPMEDLDRAPGGGRVCRDAEACVQEVCRQERNAWPDHEFARPA